MQLGDNGLLGFMNLIGFCTCGMHKMADNKLSACGIMGNFFTNRGTLWLLHTEYIMDHYMAIRIFL